jgi:hypothetical protein
MSSRPRLSDILRAVDPSFPKATALVADTIAEQLDADDSQGGRSWPAASYGVVAPPWPTFFIEARTTVRGQIIDRGMLVQDMTSDPRVMQNLHLHGLARPAGTHWVLGLHGFLRVDASDVILFPGMAFLHLDAQGELLDDTEQVQVVRYPEELLLPDATYHPNLSALATYIPFTLRAIGALHQHAPVTQVQVSRAQRRQAQRTTGIPTNDHYVIGVVLPAPTRRAGADPVPAKQGAERREHQVRGHFKVYTPDRPLFGRISGLVWVPAHRRGSADAGSVSKDYAIRPGEAEEDEKKPL